MYILFYIEQENIKTAKDILSSSFKNYDLQLLTNLERSEQGPLGVLLQRSYSHAYHAISMCQIMQQPLTTQHRATIYINNKEVNSDVTLELTNAAQTPALRTYLQQKYHWDSKTINLIDWEVHNRALQSYKSVQKKTLFQYIHRWLPTNAHPAITPPLSTLCPVCLIEEETNDHFIGCQYESYRTEWQTDVQAWYQTSKELKVEPILAYYILQVLLDVNAYNSKQPEFFSGKYQKLCTEQKRLGWKQIFFGRLTNTWVDIQNDYIAEGDFKGIQIIALAIKSIYDMMLKRWKHRCTHQHSKCSVQDERIKTIILSPKVYQLYESGQKLNATKQVYFNIPIELILQKPNKAIKAWIQRTEKYLIHATQQTIQVSVARTKSLANYFTNQVPSKQYDYQSDTTQSINPTQPESPKVSPSPTKTIPYSIEILKLNSTDHLTDYDSVPSASTTPSITNNIPKSSNINNKNKKIKRKTQSVRRRFSQQKRKNQLTKKQRIQIRQNINPLQANPLPPTVPAAPNIEDDLYHLLQKPP